MRPVNDYPLEQKKLYHIKHEDIIITQELHKLPNTNKLFNQQGKIMCWKRNKISFPFWMFNKLCLIRAANNTGGKSVWLRARSQIPVYGLTGRGLGGQLAAPGARFCGQNLDKVYSMGRYPFMNNNGCQICFILLPNLLVWIEMINIQKLVTHIRHCISGI